MFLHVHFMRVGMVLHPICSRKGEGKKARDFFGKSVDTLLQFPYTTCIIRTTVVKSG
jgi:hypothetical protein